MKIFIETLGCSKNTIDSEQMAAVLEDGSHEIIDNPDDADAVIVNTCAFIKDAKVESIDTILEMAELKKNSQKLLIVSGCLSQRYLEELYSEIPEADIFVGVNEYGRMSEIIAQYERGKRYKISSNPELPYCEIGIRKTVYGEASSYIRISEGCDNVCSYCVIPSIRGAFRSRTKEAIISEAEMLAARGTRELILIAQDVTAYGKDIYGKYALSELLTELCKIEELHWIRLLYCYEDSITDELIETIAAEEKICNYLDIPLQHVNDRVLNDMNRRSTTESIRNTIERLKTGIPDIHLRTTFIVGFPGETEEEFSELRNFVNETEFDRMGVFTYSAEENTLAAEMKNQIPEDVKENRRNVLMELQRTISLKKNLAEKGTLKEVMVDERCEDGTYIGRTRFDAPEIDDSVIFESEKELSNGTFVNVRITDAFDYDLTGKAEF